MRLNRLRLSDKKLFNSYLSQRRHSLAAYAFANIAIWQGLYDIVWAIFDKHLCIFFQDKFGCFMYLPPLGGNASRTIIEKSFAYMDSMNRNQNVSRIHHVGRHEAAQYEKFGFRVTIDSSDYICRRQDMAALTGSAFKKKRASARNFQEHYNFTYRPYCASDKTACLSLYESWMQKRKQKYADAAYQQLLDDNSVIFKEALRLYRKLDFVGRVISINKRIVGATIGYPLNKECFVILFEVCDLSYSGIAAYIFREFCRQLPHPEINIMDDSGLSNLARVKSSYRPQRIEPHCSVRHA